MRYKTFNIKIQFVNNLLEKEKALGTCERITKNKNNILIRIDTRDSQLETISTLIHEFTHFVINLMTKRTNYEKYFNNDIPECIVVNVRDNITEEQEDELEEKLCREIEKKVMKLIRRYVGLK